MPRPGKARECEKAGETRTEMGAKLENRYERIVCQARLAAKEDGKYSKYRYDPSHSEGIVV